MICYTYGNYLVEVTNKDQLGPELAESWEGSKGATVWTFKLRKGVEFHNGQSLTAADVIATYQHHRSDNSPSPAKPIVKPIIDMSAPDKHTVVFTLESGNAEFPWTLTDYHLHILPAKNGAIDWASGVGCGGYKIEEFKPGVRALLSRFPNYWKTDRAFFDEAEMLVVHDVAARQNALMTGQVDAMDRVDLKTASRLNATPGIKVVRKTGTQHYVFAAITTRAPFDDNDVRLALKYAIDREELVQKILHGYGVVGNDNPISPVNRFFARDLPQRTYDPERAKFHLRKAGKGGLAIELSAADAAFPDAVDAAVLYQKQAEKAGIAIKVVREPNDGYWVNVSKKKPFCASFWGGRPVECWMFNAVYAAGSPWNETFWNHERFNQILKEARAELDKSKRREMVEEMQRIVRDEGGAIVPMFADYVDATSEKVQHDKDVASNWELDGTRAIERWWFT